MTIVEPITIDDADYTGGNLVESDTIDAPEWVDNTAYERGDAVRIAATHSIYDCLEPHTSDDGTNDPVTEAAAFADPLTPDPDTPHWVYRSQTNKYRLFDGRPSQRATHPDGHNTIVAEVTLPSRVNAIALMSIVDASSATVRIFDPDGDETFERTVKLNDPDVVTDWRSYFYSPNRLLNSFVLADLPITIAGDVVYVSVSGGDDLAVGQIVMGYGQEFGFTTPADTGLEGLDYSHVENNYAGDIVTVRRAATNVHRFALQLPAANANALNAALLDLRGGKRALYIGSATEGARIWQYGFWRRFRVDHIDNNTAHGRLTVQGVV